MVKRAPAATRAGRGSAHRRPRRLPIVWLNRVRTQFSQDTQKRIEAALREAYAQTENLNTIVVCDKMAGYTVADKPDVLAIELVKQERSFPRIVKIGDVGALRGEYEAWEKVKPYLESPDPLFVSLTDPTPDQSRKILEYDAASRALSTSEVASLEDVVVRSCRWGSPTPESVAQRIRNIFDYMHRKLFVHARPKTADETAEYYRRKLKDRIRIWWRRERVAQRRPLLLTSGGKPHRFQDVVDWLNWLLSPAARNCIPECIFGPCHGDLHGRNVLVGLGNGEAIDEAVYDFDKMSLDRPVAWDFAKLEMELRVRALPFAVRSLGESGNDVRRVVEFEQLLYQWTKKLSGHTLRPIQVHPVDLGGAYPDSWRRLLEILLEIRRCAQVCLSGRERSECWKEEYLFTLAAYAVHTAKYTTYDKIHQTLAYLAGGVAAAHFASPDLYCPRTCPTRICIEDAVWTDQTNVGAGEEPFGMDGRSLFPNYVVALADPKKRALSRNRAKVRTAIADLGKLREAYPHAVAIEQEWALAKIELSTLFKDDKKVAKLRSEAERVLSRLLEELPAADEETLGKLGRYHKECAWAINRFGQQPTDAEKIHYHHALECYQQAYELRRHYYPGINVATLHVLLGDNEEAAHVAREVLKACSALTHEELQDVVERNWVEATQGEAYLILKQYERAVECYCRAMSLDPTAAYAESPRRHARCILAKLPDDDPGKKEWEPKIGEALGIPVQGKSKKAEGRTKTSPRRPVRRKSRPRQRKQKKKRQRKQGA